ncbi:MAG: hypothetical protein FWE67_00165 [Planctomycetaceae bacterium]|nr:hypothetical protein [Planctomycetaceae bacterium]
MRTVLLLCLSMLLLTGCGTPKPEGMPDLYPVKVKVHDGGKALDVIGVEFYKTGEATQYSLGGVTDSSGNADVLTISGKFTGKGLPAGSYRVVLRQRVEIPAELQEDENVELSDSARLELEKKRKKFMDENLKFSSKLSSPAETPLKIEVSQSGGELDVDVSQYK